MRIETERLSLRPFQEGDEEDAFLSTKIERLTSNSQLRVFYLSS